MIYVVCVNPESNYHMAYRNGDERGWGYSVNDAVVDLLVNAGEIEIEEIQLPSVKEHKSA
jgi:hypothetical protein